MPPPQNDILNISYPQSYTRIFDSINILTGCTAERCVRIIDGLRGQTDRIRMGTPDAFDVGEEEHLLALTIPQLVSTVTKPLLDVMKLTTITFACGQQELRDLITGLNTVIARLDQTITVLNQNVVGMDGRLEDVGNKIDVLSTDVQNIESGLVTEIQSVETGLAAGIQSVGESLGKAVHGVHEDANVLAEELGFRFDHDEKETMLDREDNSNATSTIVAGLNGLLDYSELPTIAVPTYHVPSPAPPVAVRQFKKAEKHRGLFGLPPAEGLKLAGVQLTEG